MKLSLSFSFLLLLLILLSIPFMATTANEEASKPKALRLFFF